jgi:hypothetical protein
VHADLDTLCIALYVMVDELLGPRRGPGRRPKLSDAELICLAVAQVLLGCSSERRWLRFAGRRLGHLFPYLPSASAYNKRLRRAGPLVALAIQDLAAHTPSFCDQLRLVDSTRCRARPPARRSAARRWPARLAMATARATTASSGASGCMSWPPRTGSRSPGAWPPQAWGARGGRRDAGPRTPPPAAGLVILADKGFAGRDFEQLVAGYGASLVRPDRADEPGRHGSLGRWRQWIESTFDTLKDQLGLERHGGRTLPGVLVRVARRLLALAAAIWWNWETGAPTKRSLLAYDH